MGRALDLTDASLDRALAPSTSRDPEALHAAFRAPGRPRFFAGADEALRTAAAVAGRSPDHVDAILARAGRIMDGRFDLLGHRDLDYGSPIDWQRDPLAGLSAPLVHWSRVPYLDPTAVGDHKVVWELNRQQYLVTLAQAWGYTGDERYATEAARHIQAWIDHNPPSKVGINWASSLEVAFRAMSWLWALHLLCDSSAIGPDLHARMLGMLHIHGRHLESYLSTYFSPNTHLTGEALGLVYLGVLLPELRHAARWRALGVSVLEGQLPIHVRPDGVYFEQASQYHRYTTEIYLHLLLLAEGNGIALTPRIRTAVAEMFGFLRHLVRPDGLIPLLGDDDGGRLVQLDDRLPADVRALLATGAVVLDSPELASAAGGDIAAMGWLLGTAALERFDALIPTPPAGLSRGFPDGGFYILRDGWEADSIWAAVDCGPHGAMNCGHAHADALAIELYAAGRPILVDSGTYSYPGPERNEFRGTAAHNAVTVDGAGSSDPGTPFQWRKIATCTTDRWITAPRFTAFAGAHDGFRTLTPPIGYRRELLLLHGDYLVVREIIDGEGDHEVAAHWHLAPGLTARILPETRSGACTTDVVAGDGRSVLRLVTAASGPIGSFTEHQGWLSPTYGRRERSVELTYQGRGHGRHEIVTFLLPLDGTSVPTSIDVLEQTSGGLVLGLSRPGGGMDWLLLRSASVLMEWEDVRTDAEWTWLRRGAEGELLEWLAIGARRLSVGGASLVDDVEAQEWRGGTRDALGTR